MILFLDPKEEALTHVEISLSSEEALSSLFAIASGSSLKLTDGAVITELVSVLSTQLWGWIIIFITGVIMAVRGSS